jgi:hypothetical protein
MKPLLLAALLFLSWPKSTTRFWRSAGPGVEYIVRDVLGGHHDRVCGEMAPAPGKLSGWDFSTIRSGGARHDSAGNVETAAEAAQLIEKECR